MRGQIQYAKTRLKAPPDFSVLTTDVVVAIEQCAEKNGLDLHETEWHPRIGLTVRLVGGGSVTAPNGELVIEKLNAIKEPMAVVSSDS